MKKQLTRTFALLTQAFALSILFAASAAFNSASAQTARTIFVRVPFEFVVGEERLPAGDYTVRRILSYSEKVLLIRSSDGRAATTIHTNAAGPRASSSGAKLVFTRHGEQYFLTLVSSPGGQTTRALPKSRIQRSLERELSDGATRTGDDDAKARAEGSTVTIIGGLR